MAKKLLIYPSTEPPKIVALDIGEGAGAKWGKVSDAGVGARAGAGARGGRTSTAGEKVGAGAGAGAGLGVTVTGEGILGCNTTMIILWPLAQLSAWPLMKKNGPGLLNLNTETPSFRSCNGLSL